MPRPRRVSARSAAARANRVSASKSQAEPEPEEPVVVAEATPAAVEQLPETNVVAEADAEAADVDMEPKVPEPVAGEPPKEKPAVETESELDPDEESLLKDSSYLVDIALGYGPETNLKMPLKGFTAEDEVQLFPVIDSMSSKLFTIVQKMTEDQKKDVEAAIKSKKGIIKICDCPKALLYHVNFLEPPSDADKSKSSKRAPHPFLLTEDENIFTEDKLQMLRAVLDAGWKREVVMRSPGSTGRKTGDVYYYSPEGTKYRSSKQVAQHLATVPDSPFTIENFSFAKVRISTNPDQEIVRKAYDGKSPPRAPQKSAPTPKPKPPPTSKGESSKSGPKASTSKESAEMDNRRSPAVDEPVKGVSSRRSIQPPKRYSGDAVLLLSKRSKVSDDKRGSNASKGLMQMGMLPPKYPKGMEDSSSNLSEGIEPNDHSGSQEDSSASNSVAIKEIAEDSLFQISALRQSGRIDVDKMHQYVESQKQLAQKVAEQARVEEPKKRVAPPVAGRSSKREEIMPCSIRCFGMTGEPPSLQCTRCLCCFHAECLGLPLNLNYPNFICSNCEVEPSSSTAGASATATATTSSQDMKKNIMLVKKPGEIKRPPPPLMRATSIPRGASARKEVIIPHPHSHPHSHPHPSRESLSRLPQKIGVPSPSQIAAMGRGMGRGRGVSSPLIRSPASHHPGQRMIAPPEGSQITIMSAGPNAMKRGRGRPPVRGLPHMNNKGVSITHLPMILPKPPAGPPPVPNLQPMSSPKGIPVKMQMPVLPVKPRQAVPVVPNLMKSNAFKISVPPPSLSGRTFKKVVTQSQQIPSNLKLNPPMINKTPQQHGYAQQQQHHDKSAPLIKRYPQSICTIGTKKFVVLPRKSKSEFIPTSIAHSVAAVGNGMSTTKIAYAGGDGVRPEPVKKVEITMVSGQNNGSDTTSSQNSLVKIEKVEGKHVPETMDEGLNDTDCVAEAGSKVEELSVKINTEVAASSDGGSMSIVLNQ